MVEVFTEIVGWIGFIFGAYVIGMSLTVFLFYWHYRHTYLLHIALMAASYVTTSVLMILARNYRVFYEGVPRFIASAFLLTAFIEGTIGLWLIFSRRNRTHEA